MRCAYCALRAAAFRPLRKLIFEDFWPSRRADPSKSRADRYQSVDDTIVQWFRRRVARIIATHLIASDMRNEGECHV